MALQEVGINKSEITAKCNIQRYKPSGSHSTFTNATNVYWSKNGVILYFTYGNKRYAITGTIVVTEIDNG